MSVLWCNGEWIEDRDFKVAPTDRGLLHGYGLFETMLAVDGRVVFGDRHAARMVTAAGRLGWHAEAGLWIEHVPELLDRNGLQQGRARVRLAVTAGSGALTESGVGEDRLVWMSASRVQPASGPLKVMVSPWRRNECSPLAGLKCASYAENLVSLQTAKRGGFDEVLIFNTQDELCEAAMANVFLVRDGQVLTPSLASGCLPGVTREVVIGLADAAGVVCLERVLNAHDLAAAEEVFLTSATQGVRTVGAIGDRALDGGDVSARLRAAWEELAGLR